MDHSRYLGFKSVVRALDRFPDGGLDPHEHERLRDTAEALLLTADPDDAEPLRRDAAIALSLLVIQRRCDQLSADVLWHAICDCGPPAGESTRRPSRSLTFVGAL